MVGAVLARMRRDGAGTSHRVAEHDLPHCPVRGPPAPSASLSAGVAVPSQLISALSDLLMM